VIGGLASVEGKGGIEDTWDHVNLFGITYEEFNFGK